LRSSPHQKRTTRMKARQAGAAGQRDSSFVMAWLGLWASARSVRLRSMHGPAEQGKFLAALAKDLKAHAGKSIVIPGLYQDPAVAILALAINDALGTSARPCMSRSQ